jgi:hypothetical protein
MIPTAKQVLDFARKLCHDTEIPGGQRYTDAYLREFAQSAWSDLFQAYAIHQLPRAKRRFYYILPAFTDSLAPAALGIDIGDLQLMEERVVDPATILGIANVQPHTSKDALPVVDQCRIYTTNQAHGFIDGDRVTVWGVGPQITDDINDQWMVRPVGDPAPYEFVLMGCSADATDLLPYSPIQTASVIKSSNTFSEMSADSDQGQQPLASQTLGKYEWREGRLHFRGSASTIQLRLTLNVSPDFPILSTQSLGINGCFNVMAYAIAARALMQDDRNTAIGYAIEAWGPSAESGQPNLAEPGGHLQNFLRPQRRQQQNLPPIVRPGYGFGKRSGMRQWFGPGTGKIW